MVIVWLLVVLVVGCCLFVMAISGGVLGMDKMQRKAVAKAPAILDAAFDGRTDVVFKLTMVSLPYEQVILGAKERGYRVTNQSDGGNPGSTLLFEKRL